MLTSFNQSKAQGNIPELNETQRLILDEYFHTYIDKPLSKFIEVSPENARKREKLDLIRDAALLPPTDFRIKLDEIYPEIKCSDNEDQKILNIQVSYFRMFLTNYNALCQLKLQFSHPIYQDTFDKKISPMMQNNLPVTTKMELVKNYYTIKVQDLCQSLSSAVITSVPKKSV